MFGIGFSEILLILVVALVVIGPKRLPELARILGRGLAEIRRASDEFRGVLNENIPAGRDVSPHPYEDDQEPDDPYLLADAERKEHETPGEEMPSEEMFTEEMNEAGTTETEMESTETEAEDTKTDARESV